MAGIGKRMRPHTLSTPKPLIKIAGKPIVQRLVEDISRVIKKDIEEIGFVIGDFGKEVEANLLSIAENIGVKGKIYFQHQALGTAHAIFCAEESIIGEVVVAFADTLFRVSELEHKVQDYDGTIWVHKVDDPSLFGVVLTDKNNTITDFIEKPKDLISNLAIIGIYYFKDGDKFRKELKYLIDNNIIKNGEYQLTDVLQNMMKNGIKFTTEEVDEWLDCGNKNATVYTNGRILDFNRNIDLIAKSAVLENSVIIPPCFIGGNAVIKNSVIGPFVSVGNNTMIEKSVISNSIIQDNSVISGLNIDNSMIGNYVNFHSAMKDVSIGDYNMIND
jgi:glucose-1-phosphate thymidylyltransferase